jgi:hypothetical protein
MDEVITRIIEVEKQCATDVEQTEAEYLKRIEAHKRILEEKKITERAQITAAESTRLKQAVEKAKRQTETDSAVFRRTGESRLQDPVLNEAIKKDIISILLMN